MAISLYYYLIPVAEMYLRPARDTLALPNRLGYRVALSLSLLGMVVLGVVPATALSLSASISQVLGR